MMPAIIHHITPNTPAHKSHLAVGDTIVSINGSDQLRDLFDWQFAILDEVVLQLEVNRKEETLTVELINDAPFDSTDAVGVVFESPIFTPIKTCNNACPFCFIDQQPEGLRPNLYVKDDDWRLSYFNNTYITLTNLTDDDRQRIAQMRPGPLYVSVHCTVAEIRRRMLKNPKFGGEILKELGWLESLGIPVHCQIVVCPGINNGDPLTQTLTDLLALDNVLSIAVIPVGLTQHRDHLDELTPVDEATAKDVIARVTEFQKTHKVHDTVFLSDEFYYKASLPLPAYDAYGEFPQLEDGVGTARMLLEDFYTLASQLPGSIPTPANYLVLTGQLAAMTLAPIVQRLNEIEGLYLDLVPIKSTFWGGQVDVAGLVTGQDIVSHLRTHDVSGYTAAVIPSVMLKEDTTLFLDGMTVKAVSQQVGVPFRVVNNATQIRDFLDILLPTMPLASS